jgi:hypothetical protein
MYDSFPVVPARFGRLAVLIRNYRMDAARTATMNPLQRMCDRGRPETAMAIFRICG